MAAPHRSGRPAPESPWLDAPSEPAADATTDPMNDAGQPASSTSSITSRPTPPPLNTSIPSFQASASKESREDAPQSPATSDRQSMLTPVAQTAFVASPEASHTVSTTAAGAEGSESTHRGRSFTTSAIPDDELVPGRQDTLTPSPNRRDTLRPTAGISGSGRSRSADDISAEMGSIRVGTSALVSALTNLPWDADDEDDKSSHDGDESSRDDEDEDAINERMSRTTILPARRPKQQHLHSSLATIRPMETSPRATSSSPSRRRSRHGFFTHHHPKLDFPFKENTIARRAHAPSYTELAYQFAEEPHQPPSPTRPPPRVASSSTIRPVHKTDAESSVSLSGHIVSEGRDELSDEAAAIEQNEEHAQSLRMGKLAERLQEVFGLEDQEEVLAEMHCWLLHSIMLKGYMFLTHQNICFFAHIPHEDENAVIKSGPLWKKSSRTKLSTKFWFMLRNDVLSWFESSKDPYFPKGNVSLQYATSCEQTGGARFKLRTSERNYTFTADTEANADEWIRVINKVIFKTQHEGESVKLIIPLDAVVEVERSPTVEFAETMEIKVVDAEDSMSVDSYFFASFPDNDYAFTLLQQLVKDRPSTDLPRVASSSTLQAEEGTNARAEHSTGHFHLPTLPKIGSVLRPLIGGERSGEDTRVPIAPPRPPALPVGGSDTSAEHSEADSEISEDGRYPPKQTGPPPPGMEGDQATWGPSWIRNPAAKLFGSSPSSSEFHRRAPPPRKVRRQSSVTEIVEPALSTDDDDETSELDSIPSSKKGHKRAQLSWSSTGSNESWGRFLPPKSAHLVMPKDHEDETTHKFHTTFALPEKEQLLMDFSGYLYRILPVHGRFFISTNYFCFRASNLLYKTKMIVPIRDLYGVKPQKAFRFGHSALIVIIKGHEEMFLEFSSSRRRDECMTMLEERMEFLRNAKDDELHETRITEDFDDSLLRSPSSTTVPSPMFGSATSSLLDFKPEPMNITVLTIGSRGDVQPYIALCKGLKADGHTTTIATHGEYREWVEGHGIGFASVGGDPAELMQLCVDNGMFTVSFLKEGLSKFRSWLDDLLNSAWEACQGADLLIESPSAMAGIHVAEALRIPYYRAFTMPWTRTRAYPQAFAVPEHNRGGSYNYMTYVMFDQVFWHAISGQINRWRRNVLGLDATNLAKLEQDKVPFLYNFSPTVVPPPIDWTEWIHVTGYWFLDNASGKKDWAPPPGIAEFIDNAHAKGKKVVYIGFGSIVVSDPQEMTRVVVESVVQSGVYAILSKGWSDRGTRDGKSQAMEEDIAYPDSIYPIDAIDHSWLFPRIDAACHHGGAGTTGASLSAGIPTIIKPFFGDQSFWAERMESLGVGAAIRKLSVQELSDALIQATTNERQIAKAKTVGAAIRQEKGVARAIEDIYRDLEYARAIIKPPPSDKSLGRRISTLKLRTASSSEPHSPALSRTLSRIQSHSRSNPHSRTHSRTHSRSHSHSTPGEHVGGPASDESWTVVSDSGPSHMSSPALLTDVFTDNDDERSGKRLSVSGAVSGLGSLVGQLLPTKSRPESRQGRESR